VAYLATVSAAGSPHLVPITFAVYEAEIVSIVDHKPKSTGELQRLRNILAHPRVSLLTDNYDEDWHSLWWARADGIAELIPSTAPQYPQLRQLLVGKYPQYQADPPFGHVVHISVERWSGWSAAQDAKG
jgi:PPOX class probable F420-dependent enzyme